MGMLSELMKSVFHPTEIGAMFKVKYGGYVRKEHVEPLAELALKLDDLDFCYSVLNKVSRSFAVVIQQLAEELKDAIMVFYLVLRGLDSVEDDMTFDIRSKLPLLVDFYLKLEQDGWTIKDVGDSPDYRILLANFDKVIRIYKTLKPEYRKAISEITRKMGKGMADFQTHKVRSVDDYNLYCHYVAGLVGYGLSDLFAASNLEDPGLADEHALSNSMGLFLQKTNIIRDYLEDLEGNRSFWPEEIWSQYAAHLSDFKKKPTSRQSLDCLNHLITDALQHAPDSLLYLSHIKNPQIFRFCAIPQVMAISTLALIYNNPNVFTSVVKVRKGLTCKIMLNTNDMASVKYYFSSYANEIARRISADDINASETHKVIERIKSLTENAPISKNLLRLTSFVAWLILIVITVFLMNRYHERRFEWNSGDAVTLWQPLDVLAMAALTGSIAYLFGFFGIQYV